jgi:hypothetical protein
MGEQSHTSGSGRERYERIAATANEVAQVIFSLAQGAPTPLDLVVQNITTLIDDAAALSASTPPSPRLLPAPLSPNRGATTFPPPSRDRAIRQQVATLDEQIATKRSGLAAALSDAKQACKALAAVSSHPDPSLLHAITAALRRISTCCQTLGQLIHERTVAVSSLDGLTRVSSPIDALGPVARATREALAPTRIVPMPGPAPRQIDEEWRRGPRHVDDGRRGPRITGPTAF